MLGLGATLAGRYRVDELLRSSALEDIYRARDCEIGISVTLRVLSAELCADRYLQDRLGRKAEALARLQHDNLVHLRGVGSEAGLVFVVSEYVEGNTLAARMGAAGGPLPLGEILGIVEQVCAALDYGHSRGVVHGDISPTNTVVQANGAALLADYGIVRTIDASILDQAARPARDLAYASPERCLDQPLTPQSDLYALGVVLFEMATGARPFAGDGPSSPSSSPGGRSRAQHLHNAPPSPGSLNSALPEAVELVILRCLAEEPQARYASAREMARALRAAVPPAIQAAVPAPSDPQAPRPQRALPEPSPAASVPAAEPGVAKFKSERRRWPRWAWAPIGLAVVVLGSLLVFWMRGANAAEVFVLPSITRSEPAGALSGDSAILDLAPGVTLALVRVPAGDFVMGSPESDDDGDRSEQPQHTVYLDEYWIGRYEVTTAQWQAFVEATNYPAATGSVAGAGDLPARFVSWDDVAFFCAWASQVTGQDVHLPTEAQWEKAARGADGRMYPWGNDAPTCATSSFFADVACVDDVTAVGSYSPAGDSPYGCADMAGNLWEWVQDWYGPSYYATSPERNPKGPGQGMYRALRGGGWMSAAWRLRAAMRFRADPTFRCPDLGFRVSVSP